MINCIIVDDEHIAREVLATHLQKIDIINISKSCKNAAEAFNTISSEKVDLVFLDINMPEISGLAFAQSINKNIKVIFTTAYREYAIDGFDLQAVDYLLKPISFERLLKAVYKFTNENVQILSKPAVEAPKKSDFIFVRADRKMVKINFSEILYIESLSDYIQIHFKDKTITTRETISNIEAKLPQNQFLRAHRSFIISIDKIELFTNEFLEVGNKAIPISRTYKNDVLKKLESL